MLENKYQNFTSMDFKTIQEVIKKKQEEVELIQAEIMLQEKTIQNLAYDLEDIEDVQKKSSTDLLESISPIDPASMNEEILQLRSKIIDRINKMKKVKKSKSIHAQTVCTA